MHKWTLIAMTLLLSAGVSLAQKTVETDRPAPTRQSKAKATEARPADAKATDAKATDAEATDAEVKATARERVRKAIRLPRTTQEARREGASEEDVQKVLKTGRERGIPAGEMQEILEQENEELREGRKDNFGASVQEMKASGLRGKELAAAIHAEQVARGMKKPKDKSKHMDDDGYAKHDKSKKSKGKDKSEHGDYDDEGHDERHDDGDRDDDHAERAGKDRDRDQVNKAKDRLKEKGQSKGKGKDKAKGNKKGQ